MTARAELAAVLAELEADPPGWPLNPRVTALFVAVENGWATVVGDRLVITNAGRRFRVELEAASR